MKSFVHCCLVLVFVISGLFADPLHRDEQFDATIAQANELYLNADFDGGLALIKQLESTHPDSPAVSYFIATGYWWKIFKVYVYDKSLQETEFDKDFDYYLEQTISRSEELLERNKRDIVALFYLGNAYSLKSRVKGLRSSYFSAGRDAGKGKNHLELVLKYQPNQYDTYYNLGVYNYLAGTLPGYAKVLKTFLFLPGGSKEKGLSYLKIAAAKSTYFGAESQLILARFYADFEEQPQEAIRIVEGFHARYPQNAWYHFWLGTLLSDEVNDYEKAERIYREILQQCSSGVPSYTSDVKNLAWLKLARVKSRRLFPEKAIEEIKLLISQKPVEPSWILSKAYLDLGNIYDQIGMRTQAVSAYTQVLNLKDYRKHHEEALKLKNQNYNQRQADLYRMNLEGRRLAAEGKFAESEASFQAVMQKFPNNDLTIYYMAELDYLRGNYKQAEDALKGLLTRNPKDPKWLIAGVYVKLGQVYEASQKRFAARRSYEKALETKFIASDDRNAARRGLKQVAQSRS